MSAGHPPPENDELKMAMMRNSSYDDEDWSLNEYGDEVDSNDSYGDEEDDFDEDDEADDYDDFLTREFPGHAKGSTSLKSHWRWTAWVLIALFGLVWMWTLAAQ
jgi:hypothetical protein